MMTFLERYNISPVLFAFISLVTLFVTYQIVGSLVAVLLFGIKINPENVTGYRILTAFSQIIFLLIPTLLLTKLASSHVWEFLRYKRTSLLQIIIPFVGIFSLQQILQVYLAAQEMIPVPESLKPFLDQMKRMIEESYRLIAGSADFPELVFVIIVIALVPAFAEETLFRGMVQRSLENSLNPKKAIILTGVIFGLFHLNPVTFIPLSIIGFYLGFLAFKSQSIFVPVSAHFFNNLLAVITIHLNYGDDELITGKPSEMPLELLLITFVTFSLVFVLSIYYFIRVSNSINLKTITEV
ncbi:MAG: CPBP family intramembrane metalloprotease [Bacteroidota bacterium]|nr:CPBP family intramembrane metalloprotease [Bacteroidota bacterium]